jgi:DnaJ-domain-containing protein 1
VTANLNAARVDGELVAAEKKVEREITELLDTLKQSPSMANAQQASQCKSCGGNKNKLLAELKILRMLQVRVNVETKDTDATRAALAELSQPMRDKIVSVRDSQDQVRTAMDKLHKSVCPDCVGGNH